MDEKVRENYENAVLELLLDCYAEDEGRRQMEAARRLNEDPNFVLPEGLTERSMETIRAAFRRKRWAGAGRFAKKAGARIAAVLVVCGSLCTVLYCTVGAFRRTVQNIFFSGRETYSSITATDTEAAFPTWHPEGYTENILSNDPTSLVVHYINSLDDSDVIRFFSMPASMQINVDTETARQEPAEFRDFEAWWLYEEEETALAWIDADRDIQYYLCGANCETLLHMAESIYP